MKTINIDPKGIDFYSELWKVSCFRLVHLANELSHFHDFPRHNIDAMLNAIDILEDIDDLPF